MSNSGWLVRTLATCAAATTLASATMAATAPVRSPPPVPVLNWAACRVEHPSIECATARVPLDYDRPRGATIELALARTPATDTANKIGTVFVNPGGPGLSGVDLIFNGFGAALGSWLQGRFDIVGFDPRGVASSSGLQCFDTQEQRSAYLAATPLFPFQQEQQRPFFNLYRSLAGQCFGGQQPIVSHMSTVHVVRDLDLLRKAVGDERLTYLGFSYGSYIGNIYANLFPRNVRALVIDGVLDPRLFSNGRQIVSDRIAPKKEFDEFLRLCDEAAAGCAFSGPSGAAARYHALADALRASPLVLEDGSLYSYDVLIVDTVSALFVPELWGGPDGYAALLDSLADAVLGVRDAIQRTSATRQAIQTRLGRAVLRSADYDNSIDALYGNHCADVEYPRSFAAYRAFGAFAARGSIFGSFAWWSVATACADWPAAADRYVGPWSVRTSEPVLVVGNFFDGITGYEGAVASSQLLRNSRLLSYAGWGHTAFGRSACATEHIARYLLDGTLPAAGTVCPANPNPFLASSQTFGATKVPLIGLPPRWPAHP